LPGPAAPFPLPTWGDQLPTLPGDRVTLRAIDDPDAAGLLAIFGDAEVVRYWSRPPLSNLAAAAALVDEIQEGFFRRHSFHWGVEDAASGELVGVCMLGSLNLRHRRAEVGFVMRRDRWGQGLASASLGVLFAFCFGTLGLHRLEADVDPDNARSLRLLERLGFQREGRLRERWNTYGTPRDGIFLGLLRREWPGPGGR
jgi:RimJ/RimL family protein N-acetyltransferase